jgi:hypothetical protein
VTLKDLVEETELPFTVHSTKTKRVFDPRSKLLVVLIVCEVPGTHWKVWSAAYCVPSTVDAVVLAVDVRHCDDDRDGHGEVHCNAGGRGHGYDGSGVVGDCYRPGPVCELVAFAVRWGGDIDHRSGVEDPIATQGAPLRRGATDREPPPHSAVGGLNGSCLPGPVPGLYWCRAAINFVRSAAV